MATRQVLHHSEPGGHAENQDAFLVRAHPLDTGCLLCALADGQGGQAGAAAAARLACLTSVEAACACAPDELFRPQAWEAVLRQADAAVAHDPEAGFTTLVALAIRDGSLCGASSGDSAAVAAHGGEAGVILTRHQFKNPPVGSGEALFVPFVSTLGSPWTVLALSDGVWKYAGWENVLRAVRAPGVDIVATLRRQAALPGSGGLQDDFTLVVIRG